MGSRGGGQEATGHGSARVGSRGGGRKPQATGAPAWPQEEGEKKPKAMPSHKLPSPPWSSHPFIQPSQSFFKTIQSYTLTDGPLCQTLCLELGIQRDFPGGPVAITLGNPSSIPGQETRSHMPQLRSLRVTTKGSACHNKDQRSHMPQ